MSVHATPSVHASPSTDLHRFTAATPDTLGILAERVDSGRLSMLFAGASIGSEAAALALALDHVVRRDGGTDERHYSFFANSAEEAVFGTIKLLRHNAVLRDEASTGRVLVVDTRRSPGAPGSLAMVRHLPALHAGVDLVDDAERARELVAAGAHVGLVAVRDAADPAAAESLVMDAGSAGLYTALADLDPVDPGRGLASGTVTPDVLVYGENLGGDQVPFGCFVMPAHMYAAWNNVTDSLAHTSTFGANGACLDVVADHLRRAGILDDEALAEMGRITSDRKARNAAFRRHVNPKAASGLEMFGQDVDVVRAHGMVLEMRDGTRVLDCAGGTGASLRGHNPAQAVAGPLTTHVPGHDYLAELEEEFRDALGDVRILPAVSGATSVDAALSTAVLAADKPTILAFRGNYSGKTIPSINLSKHGPQRSASHPRAFAPYSDSVVYLDPWAPDAVAAFDAALAEHELGLVWFELVQGLQCRPLPTELVDAIRAHREEAGYLVGIDEVLTGFHRAGEHLLHQDDLGIRADVTTLAKPLSDMVLPFGAAIVSGEVLDRATRRDPRAVALLATMYRNQLTAHVARDALRWVRARAADGSIARTKELAHARLAEAADRSPAFSGVQGVGLLLRLVPDTRRFPDPKGSQLGQLLEVSMQDLLLRRHGVLVAQQRFFPPLTPDPQQFEDALERVVDGCATLSPARVWSNAIRRIAATTGAAWARSLRRRLSR